MLLKKLGDARIGVQQIGYGGIVVQGINDIRHPAPLQDQKRQWGLRLEADGSRPAEDRSLGLGKWLENRLCGEGLDCGLIRLETLTTECQLHCTPCPVPAERTLLQIHLQPL